MAKRGQGKGGRWLREMGREREGRSREGREE